jgi:hypothetical protein
MRDKRIQEVESEGLDDGRIFIHLKPGYSWGDDLEPRRSKSFAENDKAAIKRALREVVKV